MHLCVQWPVKRTNDLDQQFGNERKSNAHSSCCRTSYSILALAVTMTTTTTATIVPCPEKTLYICNKIRVHHLCSTCLLSHEYNYLPVGGDLWCFLRLTRHVNIKTHAYTKIMTFKQMLILTTVHEAVTQYLYIYIYTHANIINKLQYLFHILTT